MTHGFDCSARRPLSEGYGSSWRGGEARHGQEPGKFSAQHRHRARDALDMAVRPAQPDRRAMPAGQQQVSTEWEEVQCKMAGENVHFANAAIGEKSIGCVCVGAQSWHTSGMLCPKRSRLNEHETLNEFS